VYLDVITYNAYTFDGIRILISTFLPFSCLIAAPLVPITF